eukprot:7329358-Ditylum_brightwellii.AAC.1
MILDDNETKLLNPDKEEALLTQEQDNGKEEEDNIENKNKDEQDDEISDKSKSDNDSGNEKQGQKEKKKNIMTTVILTYKQQLFQQ